MTPGEYLQLHGSVIVGSHEKPMVGSIASASYQGSGVPVFVRRAATRAEYEAQLPDLDGSIWPHFYEISTD